MGRKKESEEDRAQRLRQRAERDQKLLEAALVDYRKLNDLLVESGYSDLGEEEFDSPLSQQGKYFVKRGNGSVLYVGLSKPSLIDTTIFVTPIRKEKRVHGDRFNIYIAAEGVDDLLKGVFITAGVNEYSFRGNPMPLKVNGETCDVYGLSRGNYHGDVEEVVSRTKSIDKLIEMYARFGNEVRELNL
ncbi:hypothetical protein HOC01_03495 [archaeon]|nr:hypothetical protein [archaeon]MBT6698524.1 hypothetical protein [archaeon]